MVDEAAGVVEGAGKRNIEVYDDVDVKLLLMWLGNKKISNRGFVVLPYLCFAVVKAHAVLLEYLVSNSHASSSRLASRPKRVAISFLRFQILAQLLSVTTLWSLNLVCSAGSSSIGLCMM